MASIRVPTAKALAKAAAKAELEAQHKRLSELVPACLAIAREIDDAGGELDSDLEARFDGLNEDFQIKAQAYRFVIEELLGIAASSKRHSHRLAKRARGCLSAAAWLKDRLMTAMKTLGRLKLKTGYGNMSVAPNPKVQITFTGKVAELPPWLVQYTASVDMDAAHAAWAAGETLPEGFTVDDTRTQLRFT